MGHRNGGRLNVANINQHVVTARPSAKKAKKSKPAKKPAPAPKVAEVKPEAEAPKVEEVKWQSVTATPTSQTSKDD